MFGTLKSIGIILGFSDFFPRDIIEINSTVKKCTYLEKIITFYIFLLIESFKATESLILFSF